MKKVRFNPDPQPFAEVPVAALGVNFESKTVTIVYGSGANTVPVNMTLEQFDDVLKGKKLADLCADLVADHLGGSVVEDVQPVDEEIEDIDAEEIDA